MRVLERIDQAARRASRDPGEIKLVAVSKTIDPVRLCGDSTINSDREAGMREYRGRIQGLRQKAGHAEVSCNFLQRESRLGLHVRDILVGFETSLRLSED